MRPVYIYIYILASRVPVLARCSRITCCPVLALLSLRSLHSVWTEEKIKNNSSHHVERADLRFLLSVHISHSVWPTAAVMLNTV